jgi:3,4-dihydroxy 2-butanone 4-phosphate synthase/GTP cyclohydrolase II
LIATLKTGGMAILVDDEDRENEGDLIFAASAATPELVGFMIRHTSGYICVAMTGPDLDRLGLPPMTAVNEDRKGTAYAVSVDARDVEATGISAVDRARTIKVLADSATEAWELTRPGHVMPLRAVPGGVLRRAGHTEAAVDLARLAGVYPAGVLCELVSEDRLDMARLPELTRFSEEHGLLMISIADLIRYRRRHEKLVHREGTADFPTKYGNFEIHGYRVEHETQEPFALVMGDLTKAQAPLVRMHSSCFTGDVLKSLRCDCGDQLHMALQRISEEGAGALVYLPQEGRGIGLLEKIKAYALQDEGADTLEANVILGFKTDMRDYGVGIQILKDLGLTKVRLLTNNPKKLESFITYGYDLQIVDQVTLWAEPNKHREGYLRTKRDKMGHRLPPDGETAS